MLRNIHRLSITDPKIYRVLLHILVQHESLAATLPSKERNAKHIRNDGTRLSGHKHIQVYNL